MMSGRGKLWKAQKNLLHPGRVTQREKQKKAEKGVVKTSVGWGEKKQVKPVGDTDGQRKI